MTTAFDAVFAPVLPSIQAAFDAFQQEDYGKAAHLHIQVLQAQKEDVRVTWWRQAAALASFDITRGWSQYRDRYDQPYTSLSAFLAEDRHDIGFDSKPTRGCTFAAVWQFYVGTGNIISPRRWLSHHPDGTPRQGLGIIEGRLWDLLYAGDFKRLGELRRVICEHPTYSGLPLEKDLVALLEMADRSLHPDEEYEDWLRLMRQGKDPDVLEEDESSPALVRQLVYENDEQLKQKLFEEAIAAGLRPGDRFTLIVKPVTIHETVVM